MKLICIDVMHRPVAVIALLVLAFTVSCYTPLPEAETEPTKATTGGSVSIATRDWPTPAAQPLATEDLILPEPTATTIIPTEEVTSIAASTSTLVVEPAATFTLPAVSSPNVAAAATITPNPDPHLEPGFPVRGIQFANEVRGMGPGSYTLVGNIDNDPTLEIIVLGGRTGPLQAWNADGSGQQGWPSDAGIENLGVAALGNLSATSPGFEIAAASLDGTLSVEQRGNPFRLHTFTGLGDALPGWPRELVFMQSAPVLGDVEGDGLDEVFLGGLDGKLYAFKADGTSLPGWPLPGIIDAKPHLALADLDGDGRLEVIASDHNRTLVTAFHPDGTPLTGFPVGLPPRYVNYRSPPAIGDVDADGDPEIIVATYSGQTFLTIIHVVSIEGLVERTIEVTGDEAHTQRLGLALGDLSCDGTPEIIAQTDLGVYAWKGDGTSLPNWPQHTTNNLRRPDSSSGQSAPVVGDVDGDGLPDLVITLRRPPSLPEAREYTYSRDPWKQLLDGEVRAYNREGSLLPGFPKILPLGRSAVPAIEDIDLDGRNEIILSSTIPNDYNFPPHQGDRVWAYDLHGTGRYGAVQWGQYGGGPRHQGYFKPGTSCKR